MTEPTLEAKLLAGTAARSLIAEHVVAGRLTKLGWYAAHSSYYVDRVSGKPRETDVVARQFWTRHTADGDRKGTLHLIIECKTLKAWNLLFLPAKAPRFPDHRLEHWLGWELELNADRVVDALLGTGLSADEVKGALAEIDAWSKALDREDRIPFLIEAPPAPHRATAFRETNIDSQKEEPSDSVLWRASQATFSAISSISESWFEKEIADVKFGLRLGDALGAVRIQQAASWLKDALRSSIHFHPIVVIEAELRMLRGKRLKAVPWLRLELRSIDGSPDRWVDVVNADAFNAYADELTKEYAKTMRAAGARKQSKKRKRARR